MAATRCRTLAIATVVAAHAAGAAAETRSFVIGPMYMPAVDVDEKSCPANPKSAMKLFQESLPAAERGAYDSAEKKRELSMRMFKELGFRRGPADDTLTAANIEERRRAAGFPAGKGAISSYPQRHLSYDMCTDPDDFPMLAKGHQEYRGKVGYGMNLDGKVDRDDLVGVDGEKGVDNAWYQAMGCGTISRSVGDPKVGDKVIVSRQAPTLIEVSGIDDDRNDPQVEVHVYAAARALDLNATGGALAWASFRPVADPMYSSAVAGRIVDGVLTTDAFDVNLRMHESIINSAYELRRTRLRATLAEDGSFDGYFFAYQTLASLEDAYAQASTVGADMFSCPAEILSLRRHADGVRDPRTGRNTAISVALRFKAVPAFIVHPDTANAKVASK